jgi:hypothetical protein
MNVLILQRRKQALMRLAQLRSRMMPVKVSLTDVVRELREVQQQDAKCPAE